MRHAAVASVLARPGSRSPRRLTEREKVVRAFLRDGRLVSIPAKPGKRDLLLPVILDRCFPEDRDYEEKEVNMRLALLHPDVAALRRYLVDGGLMTREAGIYRGRAPTSTGRDSEPTAADRRPRARLSGARSTRSRRAPSPFVYSPPTTGSISPRSPSLRR